jgi:hypothetical protein
VFGQWFNHCFKAEFRILGLGLQFEGVRRFEMNAGCAFLKDIDL